MSDLYIDRLELIKRACEPDYKAMMEELEAEENDGTYDEEIEDKGEDW